MELQHLRTFIAVAEAGSLTLAGEAVFLSQPAVSGHVKALEAELGVALFHRAPRGVRLTEAGRELLDHAHQVVRRADGMTRLAERLRGEAAGELALGLTDCGYDVKLARMVAQMGRRHPGVDLRIIGGNSGGNRRAVLDHALDLAVVEGDVDDRRLHRLRLGASRVGVIGPAAWRDELVDADWPTLAGYPWVFQSADCSYFKLMERIGQEQRVTPRPRLQTEATCAMKALVAEGLALSIADLDDAAPELEAGAVFAWPGVEHVMPVWLIALAERIDEPAVRGLLAIAAEVHPQRRRPAETASPPAPRSP